MGKRKCRKNNERIVKYESNIISQEKMIEIQAEAYYRALKRIEDEKVESDKKKPETKKYKWYEKCLFVFNLIIWPWKINKRFYINNQIYDNVLVLVVSGVIQVIGSLMWLFGIIGTVIEICKIFSLDISRESICKGVIVIVVSIITLFWGSIFIEVGEEFRKETDRNIIYAYSASIIALISCVVSIIALIGI